MIDKTPAYKALIQEGSEVLKLDDTKYERVFVSEMINHLKRIPAGTEVDLTWKNPDGKNPSHSLVAALNHCCERTKNRCSCC